MLVYERLDALADGIAEALLGKGGMGLIVAPVTCVKVL